MGSTAGSARRSADRGARWRARYAAPSLVAAQRARPAGVELGPAVNADRDRGERDGKSEDDQEIGRYPSERRSGEEDAPEVVDDVRRRQNARHGLRPAREHHDRIGDPAREHETSAYEVDG